MSLHDMMAKYRFPKPNMPANSSVTPTIIKAARNLNIVTIKYTDSSGSVTIRDTEPYEINDGKYWAYDTTKNSIRQFDLGRISDAIITKKTFKPRWPVKF